MSKWQNNAILTLEELFLSPLMELELKTNFTGRVLIRRIR